MAGTDISRLEERPEDRIAAEAGRQFGLITRARCRQLGMSDSSIARRLVRGTWSSQSGVFLLPGYSRSWEQDVMCALLRGGPGTVASHRTAAALLGLEGVPAGTVEVYASSLKSDDAVRVHRTKALPACDVMRTRSFVHTDASRTLLDLGAVVAEEIVEVALEFALRRGLTSVPRLRWRLEQVGGRGRRGVATLRKLLNLRDPLARPAQSVLEVRFVQRLRRAGLPPYVRQHEVLVDTGRRRYIDFAFPHAMLGIEVGGRGSHTGPAAEQRDARRHNELTRLGWTLLYFTWDDVECIRRELTPSLS